MVDGPKMWNSLPKSIQNINSLNKFLKGLKDYLVQSTFSTYLICSQGFMSLPFHYMKSYSLYLNPPKKIILYSLNIYFFFFSKHNHFTSLANFFVVVNLKKKKKRLLLLLLIMK